MENTTNLNIDAKTLEWCLKSISNFGGTIYQNLCTGEKTFVAWGNADWVAAVLLSLIGIAITALFIGGIIAIIQAMLDR